MKKPQIYKWHEEHGQMVDFVGWYMPIQYSSIIEEHLAVRNSVGIFDVSHMGRFFVRGKNAEKFLDTLVPRDVTKIKPGRCAYTYVLNERAGFRDDIIIGRLSDDEFMVVCNAGNKDKIIYWFLELMNLVKEHGDVDLSMEDVSTETAMFAVQGPKAMALLKKFAGIEEFKRWAITTAEIDGIKYIISGTGYTGERGFEVTVMDATVENPEKALKTWEKLLELGKEFDIKPCGLGARDSLRMEAGYPLYGHEIEEDINPIEASLFFPPFAHIDKKSWFIGKARLLEIKDKTPEKVRVAFVMEGKRPPRQGYEIHVKKGEGSEKIGHVVSGTYSPILDKGIGMGFVKPEYSKNDTEVYIQIRNKLIKAVVKPIPLYDPDKYGHARKE